MKSYLAKYKKNSKRIFACFILLLIVSTIILYYFTVTLPFVEQLTEETVRVEAINTINMTNQKIQKLNAFYDDLYEFLRNDAGDIILIKSNASLINQISMLATTEVQNSLNNMQKKDLQIPAGAFTGSAVFSKLGNPISLRIISIGKCNTTFVSKFYAIGINHALHRLVVNVDVSIDVLVPWRSQSVDVSYQILIAENIIIGKVPTTYLAGDTLDLDYIDLIAD